MIDEYIEDKRLEKLGYTRETFKGSNTEALLESMLFSTEKTIQEETQRLMKEHSLSYGEARIMATDVVLKSIENGLKGVIVKNQPELINFEIVGDDIILHDIGGKASKNHDLYSLANRSGILDKNLHLFKNNFDRNYICYDHLYL